MSLGKLNTVIRYSEEGTVGNRSWYEESLYPPIWYLEREGSIHTALEVPQYADGLTLKGRFNELVRVHRCEVKRRGDPRQRISLLRERQQAAIDASKELQSFMRFVECHNADLIEKSAAVPIYLEMLNKEIRLFLELEIGMGVARLNNIVPILRLWRGLLSSFQELLMAPSDMLGPVARRGVWRNFYSNRLASDSEIVRSINHDIRLSMDMYEYGYRKRATYAKQAQSPAIAWYALRGTALRPEQRVPEIVGYMSRCEPQKAAALLCTTRSIDTFFQRNVTVLADDEMYAFYELQEMNDGLMMLYERLRAIGWPDKKIDDFVKGEMGWRDQGTTLITDDYPLAPERMVDLVRYNPKWLVRPMT